MSSTEMDRLQRLCSYMRDAYETHPEQRPGDRYVIVMVNANAEGIRFHGYENEHEGVTDVLRNLTRVCDQLGVHMDVVMVPPGEDVKYN